MGNQQGKLQHQNQSGRPKKAVHWKSAGESELKIFLIFYYENFYYIFSMQNDARFNFF